MFSSCFSPGRFLYGSILQEVSVPLWTVKLPGLVAEVFELTLVQEGGHGFIDYLT